MEIDTLAPPSEKELIDALAEVLDEAMSYSKRKDEERSADDAPPVFETIDAATLCATDPSVLKAKDWARDPVYRSLKLGAKEIGRIIHERVGHKGLEDVAEDVCSRDEANWSRRMSFIDSAFDGIGAWYS